MPRHPGKLLKKLRYPIWTENKAQLIERYLYYFVLITKHGTYIDAFAGPQNLDHSSLWAAKMVLESKPRWFRKFFLFEIDKKKIPLLQDLRKDQLNDKKRRIEITEGDFNENITAVLKQNPIREKEAAFCLLDQRTFECHWACVKALAEHKKKGMKIELFYFLPQGWLNRAMYAQQNKQVLHQWWGRPDYDSLLGLTPHDRAQLVCNRFVDELGYKEVTPWPIYESPTNNRIMYHMIHATDHPAATALMYRAYHKAVGRREPWKQLEMELTDWKRKGFPDANASIEQGIP